MKICINRKNNQYSLVRISFIERFTEPHRNGHELCICLAKQATPSPTGIDSHPTIGYYYYDIKLV